MKGKKVKKVNNRLHRYLFDPKTRSRHIGILIMSVISYILLMIGEIPGMKIFGVLQMQLSDTITLAAYFIYGIKGSLFTIAFRYIFFFLSVFTIMSKPFPTAELVTFTTSLLFFIVTIVLDKSSNFFKKGKFSSVVGYTIILLYIGIIMYAFNYSFSIPTLINDNNFTIFFNLDPELLKQYIETDNPILITSHYTSSLLIMNASFYLAQGITIIVIYDLVFSKNLSYILSSKQLDKNLIFAPNGRQLFIEYYSTNKYNHMIVFGKKYKKKEAEEIIKKEEEFQDVKTIYQYNFIIDKFGYIKQNSINSEHESITLISNFMKCFYPANPYKIVNYQKKEIITTNNYTDCLPEKLYRQVNNCIRKEKQIIDVNIEILKNA